jgi:hypothetical protein
MSIIASRIYHVDGEPSLRVSINKPYLDEYGSYFCEYEIDGPKTQIKSSFGGADEMQALLHAIYMIRLLLETCDEYLEGRLSLDGVKDYFGLPDPALDPPHPDLAGTWGGGVLKAKP